MQRTIYLTVLSVAACGLLVLYYVQESQPPTEVIDGATWTQILYWDFGDGFYPHGWGWGNRSIVEGKLQLQDLTGEESVYFLPVCHGGNFILETKVKFIRGAHDLYVATQLLTRDSSNLNHESGMVLLPEMDQAIVRHTANKIDYIYMAFEINMSIDYGEWYVMRFMVYNGRIRVFVDGNQIYDSNGSFPTGEYCEPHLAVRYGVAVFEYVRILSSS